jgi:hypothetical protein
MPENKLIGNSKKVNVGIPYNGLNVKNALSVLEPDSATTLENFMPPADCLEVRKGYTNWTNLGLDEQEDDLFVCDLPSSTCFILTCISSTRILKINLNGSTSSYRAGSSGLQYSACSFGNYMYFGNGNGKLLQWNGSGFSTKTFFTKDGDYTETISICNNPISFANRLFFTDEELTVYYGEPMELDGEAKEIDLSFYLNKGGFIIKSFTLSTNYNDNIMSHVCFLSSQGQVITFIGTDPADENKWSMGGIFDVGMPINKKCVADNVEGDILIFARGGIRSVRKIILGEKNKFTENLEDGLSPILKDIKYFDFEDENEGWLYFLKYIKSKKLVVLGMQDGNDVNTMQYVFSLDTGTWSKFTGLNLITLAELQDTICGIRSDNSYAAKLFYGYKDGENAITAKYTQGFTNFGSMNKKFIRSAEIFATNVTDIHFNLNFDYSPVTQVASIAQESGYMSLGETPINKNIFYVTTEPGRKVSVGATLTAATDGPTKVYETYLDIFECVN